jgi:hypothetical protein
MHPADGQTRLLHWLHVREFAVPPSMITTATTRRLAGDWAGACAAARFDVDFQLRDTAQRYGREVAALLRADLRRLAPDLLRWHLPRVSPGLLRPALTITLARYGPVQLVARTPPAWAGGGQRVSLALWHGPGSRAGAHPHPRPSRLFRLDLHRHLWDASRSTELRDRAGTSVATQSAPRDSDRADAQNRGSILPHDDIGPPDLRFAKPCNCGDVPPDLSGGTPLDRRVIMPVLGSKGSCHCGGAPPDLSGGTPRGRCVQLPDHDSADPRDSGSTLPEPGFGGSPPGVGDVPAGLSCAFGRWAAEAALLREADNQQTAVTVRLGNRLRLLVGIDGRISRAPRHHTGPVLPDAATWVPPDVELLRAGLIDADDLHPLVAAALVPRHAGTLVPERAPAADGDAGVRFVDCGGARHRIGLAGGVLTALDHDPDEVGREELLVALGGSPLPCLRAIDDAHRHPESLVDVRARLDHGDCAGALAAVEQLLGPDAVLRAGALDDELATAAGRRVAHGLYRAGLTGLGPPRTWGLTPDRPRRRHLLPR